MKRAALLLAALAAVVFASAASGQTFRIVSPGEGAPASAAPSGLPSYETPNAPGSIVVPFALSRPPATPETRSYEELAALWQRAGEAYGVPWEVLAAINKIESNFGANMGPSSAGALGWMQFIPDTWMRWGTDADGDGVADPWDPEDAVYSAARYLAAAGAHEDLERAIFAYNHAQWYVDDVMELAAAFADGGLVASPAPIWQLAEGQRRLAEARVRVVLARRALASTHERLEALPARRLAAERRAGDPTLSAAAFQRAERRAARLAAAEDRARAALEGLAAELDGAVAALEAVRESQAAVALGDGALPAAGPLSPDDFVFPVGGGPGVVSVAHDHHDYPAADIAAPEGSPLYALADSVVVDAYPEDSGRCGIGFTLRTEDGSAFVYCHLSHLEPAVVPGAALAAGAEVGLVGSTGNSTGPHLHLAFDPAVAYPQDEPWFRLFAGTAFSWQDAPTPKRAATAVVSLGTGTAAGERVFRVVRTRVVRFTR